MFYSGYSGPNATWVYVAWVAIALTGTYVQLHTAGGKTRAKARGSRGSASHHFLTYSWNLGNAKVPAVSSTTLTWHV